jgi:hypothetical protein
VAVTVTLSMAVSISVTAAVSIAIAVITIVTAAVAGFSAISATAIEAALVSPAVILVGGVEVAEVIVGLAILAAAGEFAAVAVTRVVAVIDVAIEAARAAKPGTCTVEAAAAEPLGTVVAIGRATVGRIVKVAVGARWCRAADVDADGDLGACPGGRDQQHCRCSYCCKHKSFHSAH